MVKTFMFWVQDGGWVDMAFVATEEVSMVILSMEIFAKEMVAMEKVAMVTVAIEMFAIEIIAIEKFSMVTVTMEILTIEMVAMEKVAIVMVAMEMQCTSNYFHFPEDSFQNALIPHHFRPPSS